MALRNNILEIPVGALGLNATDNIASLKPGHLVKARNISFASGALQKEGGADRYNDLALVDTGEAWTMSGASYDSTSLDVSGEDGSPKAHVLGNDGSKLFVLGDSNDTIYQYTLSTEADLGTASYDGVSLDISVKDTSPVGIDISRYGTRLFVLGASSDSVYQYDLSEAWDLSTASDSGTSLDISGQTTSPTGLAIGQDGGKLYVLDATTVYQYTMSTASDLSTASYDSKTLDVSGQDTNAQDLRFQDTGDKVLVLGAGNDNVYQYSMTDSWDISTASYDSSSFDVSGQETAPRGLAFLYNGTKFYVVGDGATVYQYSASGSPVEIRDGIDWWPDFASQRTIVYTSDGRLMRDTGNGSFKTTLTTNLSDVDDPWFYTGGLESSGKNRKLFFMNGTDAVQVLSGDGTTTNDISSPPADWSGSDQPTVGVIHEGRNWGAGNANDPHRLYYSTTADHEDFTSSSAGTLSVYPGFGRGITAVKSFKGFLMVWKEPRGVFVVDTSDPNTSNWRVFQATNAVGCSNPHLATHMRDGIAFLDHVANLWFLSTVDAAGNVSLSPMLPERQINVYVRDNIDFGTNAKKARMSWYANKSELHIPLAGLGSRVNNRNLILDMNGEVPRFRVNDRDIIVSMWMTEENGIEKPISGDDGGFVWRMDRESREKEGEPYEGVFETPPLDLSNLDERLATVDKQGMFLEVAMHPIGDWDLNVDILWDGKVYDTVTFNLGGGGAVLGSFTLGDDELAGNEVLNKIARILGSGRRISIRGKNAGKGQDFSLSRFWLHFKTAAQRIN